MPEPTRRVRQLVVRAPDMSAARGVAVRLEDALRTVSLPRSRRVLCIRKLDLGRVREATSSQSLALLLERRLRDVERCAVRHDTAAARSADVVWFPNRVAALAAFAERLQAGRADAWYWSRLVRGYRPGMPPETALRSLLAAALAGQAPRLVLARTFARLVQRRAEAALLARLTPADARALLEGVDLDTPLDPGAAAIALDAVYRALLRAWSTAWGLEDARSQWLAVMVLGQARPGLLSSSRLGAHARALLLRHGSSIPPGRELTEADGENPPGADAASTGDDVPSARGGAAARRELPPAPRGVDPPLDAPDARVREPSARAEEDDVEPGASTEYGGLYFVLRVLAQLGLEAFLEAHPHADEHDLSRRIVLELARQAGVPPDDPVLRPLERAEPLEEVEAPRAPLPFAFAPDVLRGLAEPPFEVVELPGAGDRRLLCDARGWAVALGRPELPLSSSVLAGSAAAGQRALSPEADASDRQWLLRSWTMAVERWLEAHTELTLPDLVRRPARIEQTPTHVDVFLEHEQADVRVRRAALDVDPGYVPWLGWVVTFHYGRENWR